MVDAADRDKVEASRNELHNLLEKPQLQGIPVSACCDPPPLQERMILMQRLTSSSCFQKESLLQTIPDEVTISDQLQLLRPNDIKDKRLFELETHKCFFPP